METFKVHAHELYAHYKPIGPFSRPTFVLDMVSNSRSNPGASFCSFWGQRDNILKVRFPHTWNVDVFQKQYMTCKEGKYSTDRSLNAWACTVIQFRLNQCLIWHLHCRGSKWDPCWNCAIKDTSECYIWQSMSCLSGAEIQIKLSRIRPTISSILIQYCTIEPHLLIQKSRHYVNSLVTTVGRETEVLFKGTVAWDGFLA